VRSRRLDAAKRGRINDCPQTKRRAVLWLLVLAVSAGAGCALALSFHHAIEQDSWFYLHPTLTAFGVIGTGLLLASAMYNFRRRYPVRWGYFVLLVGCALLWNATAVAIRLGPAVRLDDGIHSEYLLKIVVSLFLMVEGYKDAGNTKGLDGA